jgi:serine protease Do
MKKKSVLALSLWASAFAGGYLAYDYAVDQRFALAEEKREEVRKGLTQAEDLSTAFREIGKVVEPSVVSIEVRKRASMPVQSRRQPQMDEDMLRRFFPDRDGDGEPDLPRGFEDFDFDPDSTPEIGGTGSGVIMDYAEGKGYVLTNNHVAGGAEEITITLHDGREIRNGKLLGADAKTDLAVIQIEADRLSPAKWGNSDELQKGDWVMAFGSPYGFVGSMTHGIVSALNRQAMILGPGGYENFIQVDAPINPGNSGGPLVNLRGEVVGINTAILSRTGGFQGIGFTIPSNQAKFVYSALKEKGKVVRGWLGVSIGDVSKDLRLARDLGYEGTTGVLVQEVLAGTPAVGRLQHEDIITHINGKPVQNMHQLRNMIAAFPPKTDVQMTVFRDGGQEKVTVTLGEQPDDVLAARRNQGQREETPAPKEADTAEALGVTVQPLNSALAKQFGVETRTGVIVTRVARNSPASQANLRVGDVITEVAGKKVSGVEDFTSLTKDVDPKKGVRLYVVGREGGRLIYLGGEEQ